MPCSVAIIMDGNGRWAQRRSLPRVVGHREGARVVREITEFCREAGVGHLVLYAFSEQNWDRPPEEIRALMDLLEEYLRDEVPTMLKNGIRLRTLGDTSRLPGRVRDALDDALDATRGGGDMDLTLALSYGGREEILRAAVRLAQGGTPPERWSLDSFSGCLDSAGLPDPDVLVRTGGEMRLSNFLLWQCSYTELFFSPTPWPDFDRDELQRIFDAFGRRQRRYGQTSEQVGA